MTSKQRVHAALRRQPTDRVPIFMWFHPETAARLGRTLGIPPTYVGEAMGNDIRQTWVNNNYAMEGVTHEQDGESHLDFWGIRWVKQGPFNQIASFPLEQATADEAMAYEFPYSKGEFLLGLMDPILAERNDYFIGCDVSPCVFEMYWRLRGMQRALMDIVEDVKLVRRMFTKSADFSLWLSASACKRFSLDWLWTGDDVGGQNSMIISSAMWRDLIKPLVAKIFAVGRAHGLYVAFHSCGAIRPILSDLIEIGMDVLNPVQCNCEGMNPLELKKEFGKQVAFMGGVDTQAVLPFGSARDVRGATARLIEGMTADGGGYILAASHTVPPETPDDNVFAMYAEAGISREEIFDRASDIRRRIIKR